MPSFMPAAKFRLSWNAVKTRLFRHGFLQGVWKISLVLIFIFLIIKCVAVASTSSFSFDGGMNVQAAQNLVRNFTYATSYESPVEFDPVIQTGLPVILPVAILFFIFGESYTAGLMVNAVYMLLVVGALLYYVKYCTRVNGFFTVLALLLFLGTPHIFDLGFGLYGEIPMLFYLMMTLIFLQRNETSSKTKSIFIAGIFLGLGYLTKTVILIVVPALVFVFLYDFFVKRRLTAWGYFKQWAPFLSGFLIPVVSFEVFKLVSLGSPAYIAWWQAELHEILQQAGVRGGFTDTFGISEKLLVHINLLASHLDQPVYLIVTVLLLVFIFCVGVVIHGMFSHWRKKKSQQAVTFIDSNHFLVLLIVTLSYFGWWLLITSTTRAYFRRILIGDILLEISLVCLLSLFFVFIEKIMAGWKKKGNPWFRSIMVALNVLLLAMAFLGIVRTGNHEISFSDTQVKSDTLAAGEFIQGLSPTAEIYGYGWWQAPNVAFASGRTFKNIFFSPDLEGGDVQAEKYLVIDDYAYGMDPEGYRDVLRGYESRVAFSRSSLIIYQLLSRISSAYPDFTEIEKELVSNNIIDFKVGDGPVVFTRNVYMQEKNEYGKWAQQVSGYLLKYDGERKLRLVFVAPEIHKYDNQPVSLEIFVNKELVKTFAIMEPGVHRVDVQLKGIDSCPIEITLSSSARMLASYSTRNMAIFMVKMELLK